jgi:dynein heavy chain, axonemal
MILAKKYIGSAIGERYVDGIVLDLEGMLEESSCNIPMVCFLHMGSDPTTLIEQVCSKNIA